MWLRLGESDPALVEIDAYGDPPGTVLVDALVDAGLVESSARGRLTLVRSGTALDAGRRLSELGLRNGDVVATAARRNGSDGRAGGVDIVVGMGPAAGVTRRLDGSLTVGRDADLTLDDPGLSREHLRLTVGDGAVLAEDLGSMNGTYLFGRPLDTPTPVPLEAPLEAGSCVLRLRVHERPPAPALPLREGLAQFNRPPRIAAPALGEHHKLPAPPEPRPPRRIPLVTALAPLVIAPFLLSQAGGLAFAAILLMSPVIAFASYWEDRRHGGKEHRAAEARFRRALEQARMGLKENLPRETVRRWAAAPDVHDVVRRTEGPAPDLWERRPQDPDYLELRVGWTDLPAAGTYEIAEGGMDALREEAVKALTPHLVVRCAPLTVGLAQVGALGITGTAEQTGALARWLTIQLATLHSPRDLRIAAALPGDDGWDWLTALPHTGSPDGPTVATTTAAARRLVAGLTDIVQARGQGSDGLMASRTAPGPTVVVIVDEAVGLPRNALTTVLEDGPAVGVHVVWLAANRTSVPGQCRAIVTLTSPTVSVTWSDTGRTVEEATLDIAPLGPIESAAWNLAGLADSSSRDQVSDVPPLASYADVLGMRDPTPDEVLRRWDRPGSLTAPIGLGLSGPQGIDLRHDGPHALIGGTTGAGKSEFLQTLVASLAAHNPPERLTFLLVDYKGGAAFKDCVHLPHTVGFVTDLDRHLVHRVLISLGAELGYRERLLARVGARDLMEMERVSPESAPPSLAIVVDEFAALATELPEFVDGVVNLAQRGRSLGMHLVLATQRPAGVINDQIRANTNLRISLRMNDVADSQDVIDSPAAARLPRTLPGRGYLRTGSGELTEVQSGFGGGHSFGGGQEQPRVVVRTGSPVPAATTSSDEGATDLQRLVEAVVGAHAQSGRPAQRLPWLPELPPTLPADQLPVGHGTAVAIGLRDEPHVQQQAPHVVDLVEGGSLMVAGSSGAGKTTVLRTLAGRLAEQTSPADVHLYVLDFASRGLGVLRSLPHCGAVIAGDDVELAVRLLNTVTRWLAHRRQALSDASVSSLDELRRIEARDGRTPTPRVVVMLDGYAAFAQAFEKIEYGTWLERLPLLISEGRALGVHWVVTVDRRLAMSSATVAALPERLILRLNDVDDYDHFGLDRKRAGQATLGPGRGFTASTEEVQVAVIGDDPAGEAQIAALAALAHKLRAEHPDGGAPPIQLLPLVVDAGDLPTHQGGAAVLGIEDSELGPALVDPAAGYFLVAGPPRSGKSTALATLARSIRAAEPAARIVLLAPRRSPLTALDIWDERHGALTEDAFDELLDGIGTRTADDPPLVLVVDDMQELVDEPLDNTLDALARRGRDVGLQILCACDRSAAHRAYGGLVQRVRADRTGLLLQPNPDADGDLLGATVDRRWGGGPVGRGALVVAGVATRVQVAAWDAS